MPHVVRVSKLDLATVLSQPNPHINLRLGAYETSSRNFLKAVSNYTQRAVTEITHRKNNYVSNKGKIAEKSKQLEQETNQCKVKELELMTILGKEQEERKEAESSVAAFLRKLASIKEKCASLDVEIEQRRAIVQNLRRGMYSINKLDPKFIPTSNERERNLLDKHASQISPELAEIERRTQCAIEGIDKDKILIRFTHIDPSDLHREFSFVMDVSGKTYKVPTTSPFLPNLPILLDELNESRDIYSFIKQVRQAFEELVTHGR
ncbi:hypothetical protein QCA50_019112 [Cerrena zonata]|uniref:Kinetochore protein SPC25 n=1 Tax=Cerrena zonata TaxID=2478898 RepID=A0AAW0FL19_9APHY